MKRNRPGDTAKAARLSSTVDSPISVPVVADQRAGISTQQAVPSSQGSKQTDAEQQQQQQQQNLLTPHTLRLLKLIRNGTAQHAAQASSHLTVLTATTASPVQLWDVLGRLQGYLVAADWRTRRHAAAALQGVARHLPVTDQVHFYESTAVRRDPNTAANAAVAVTTETTDNTNTNSKNVCYLEVADLVQSMDAVLTEGRLLLATSDKQYDSGDHAEQELLQDLDQTAATDVDFVERRIQLQRRILAQRLGLLALGQVVGEQDLLPDTISSQDMVQSASLSLENKPEAKRQKHADRIRKRMQQDKDGDDDNDSSTGTHSVRALLVMKMQEERTNTVTTGAASHRSPQTLLATELIYRMFDASWHVRHGALLGTLSLLRAWRSQVGSTSFGVWPQDILARCLCVLALDRFGDFSGALAPTDPVSSSNTAAATTGGVVAPVRETAAQLLSVLFSMAPQSLQKTTLELLYRLARYPSEWEVRHGALVALKFVTVILVAAKKEQPSKASEEWNQTVVQDIARAAIDHLTDDSDDVKSVASQILSEFVRAFSDRLPQFIWDAPRPLWEALCKAKSVSSCIIDLVALFSLFLRRDCATTLQVLDSRADGEAESGGDILETLARLLDSDFGSVRNSTLQSIAVAVGPLSQTVAEEEASVVSEKTIASLCLLVNRVYDLYFTEETLDAATSDHEVPAQDGQGALLDSAWSCIADAATRCISRSDKFRDALELELVCRFFGINRKRASRDHFHCSSQAAEALAAFLDVLGSSAECGPITELVIRSYLQSPWAIQCEAACMLFRAISRRYRVGKQLRGIRAQLMEALQSRLMCIDVEQESELGNTIKSSSIANLCDQAFVEGVSGIRSGKRSVAASVEAIVGVWKETIGARELNPTSGESSRPTTVTSMRVDAALSGAILAGGLPSKITPIVRALMTSLKNEVSVARRNEMCGYIAELLRLIEEDASSKFERAHTKIISTLCNMVTDDVDTNRTPSTSVGLSGAIRVIQSVVSSMPRDKTLQDLVPLWVLIAPLSSKVLLSVDDQTLMRSANLLQTVCGGLVSETSLTFHIIDTSVPNLVFLACREDPIGVGQLCFATIQSLCKVNAQRVLSQAVSVLLKYLGDRSTDSRRLSACRLLAALLEDSGMEICPFVRCLLPLVMSLMTDPLKECSQIANNMFASLVRVAPLVREGSSVMVNAADSDLQSEAVVDHLILGKPLPPYMLPKAIEDSLKQGGIILRQYQVEGIAWLQFLQSVKLNGALCDSMGLGKTLQALIGIAIAHHSSGICGEPEQPSLIVCPSTVAGHWVSEIDKFFPNQSIFRALYFAGNASERKAQWRNALSNCNIVVTSYSVLRSDIALLSSRDWLFLCLDEGHLLKNPKTATALASRRIRARHKLILTGTPVQNHVHELWATFDFLMPNFLGSSALFAKEFAKPITKSLLPGASASSVSTGIEKLKVLHQQVLPFILRREKEQVLRELPPKSITTVKVEMSALQSKLYIDFCSSSETQRSLAALQNAINDAQSSGGGQKGESSLTLGTDALKSLLYLRLLCTHPFLVISDPEASRIENSEYYDRGASGKLVALAEILRDAGIHRDELVAADNDSSLLYCDDDLDETDPGTSFLDTDGDEGSGATGTDQTDASHGSKCLIFAQFTRSLDVVEEFLFKTQMPSLRYLRLDGRVPARKRTELVESFNKDPSIKVMLLTTRAGGLGLNLTGADTVVFLENDYNPFADLQAMDRAHRIGQTKRVFVFHLVAKDSIDEKILNLQQKKIAMSDTIVNTDNSTMYSMGTDKLLDIFTFRSDQENPNDETEQPSRYNLDALVERYGEDYASLTVEEFVRNLRQPQEFEATK